MNFDVRAAILSATLRQQALLLLLRYIFATLFKSS